jgi:hypothetical protein
MKIVSLILLVLSASLSVYGQLLPSEAAALEAAWASGDRLTHADIPLRRGFNLNAPFEHISTDATGIAATKTVQWERIEVHLPRAASVDHIACLMVDAKCRNLPVGASIDKKNSILYWHVPNAYKGDFDLVFLQPGGRVGAIRITAGSNVVTRLK